MTNAANGSAIGAVEMDFAQTGNAFVVTTTADHDDGTCGTDCTLREAINAANAHPNTDANTPDTITFSALFNSAQTIQLASALPNISDSVKITGPGANLLTVQRSTANGHARLPHLHHQQQRDGQHQRADDGPTAESAAAITAPIRVAAFITVAH